MDREIPKEVKQKERNKKIIKYGIICVVCVVCIGFLISMMRSSVRLKDITISQIGRAHV